jgi:hypothetical protein
MSLSAPAVREFIRLALAKTAIHLTAIINSIGAPSAVSYRCLIFAGPDRRQAEAIADRDGTEALA